MIDNVFDKWIEAHSDSNPEKGVVVIQRINSIAESHFALVALLRKEKVITKIEEIQILREAGIEIKASPDF